MSERREVRARIQVLRVQKGELEAKLAGVDEKEARAIRLELARVGEELVDYHRRLKELLPRHKVSYQTAWSGVEGRAWDQLQYQSWAELEGEEAPEGPTRLDRMRLAVRTARSRAVTEKQGAYLSGVEAGGRQAQVAREAGRDRSTVCRTLARGRARIERDAKDLLLLLERQEGDGPLVVDLADREVLAVVLGRLTQRQQLYLYLYYGEWMSLREIGALVGVDHASVLRSIRCALQRLERLALGEQVEVRGLDALEELLMARFDEVTDADLEPAPRPASKRDGAARPSTREKPLPALARRVLCLVRGGQRRTVELGGGTSLQIGGRWGSGRLLALLEGRLGPRPKAFLDLCAWRARLRRLWARLFQLAAQKKPGPLSGPGEGDGIRG